MKRIHQYILFYLIFSFQECYLTSHIEEQSPQRSPSIHKLDWEKFDHLYDIGNISPNIRSTPPPKLSKEVHLALNMFDHSKAQNSPRKLSYYQERRQRLKDQEQLKVEKMTKVERDAFFDQKTEKRKLASQRRKDKIGYRTYTARTYNNIKKLMDSNLASKEQIEKFEKMREHNRKSSIRWRAQHRHELKQLNSIREGDVGLTPEQIEHMKNEAETRRERNRTYSKRAREKKKLLKAQKNS